MFRTSDEDWVKVSKEAIAVLLGGDMLEEKYQHYSDLWTWEGIEGAREWMLILGEEIRKRKVYTERQMTERLQNVRVMEDHRRYRIYIDGVWK